MSSLANFCVAVIVVCALTFIVIKGSDMLRENPGKSTPEKCVKEDELSSPV